MHLSAKNFFQIQAKYSEWPYNSDNVLMFVMFEDSLIDIAGIFPNFLLFYVKNKTTCFYFP